MISCNCSNCICNCLQPVVEKQLKSWNWCSRESSGSSRFTKWLADTTHKHVWSHLCVMCTHTVQRGTEPYKPCMHGHVQTCQCVNRKHKLPKKETHFWIYCNARYSVTSRSKSPEFQIYLCKSTKVYQKRIWCMFCNNINLQCN